MAITRQAIIIGNNTGYGASQYLEGVNKDLTSYVEYLTSDAGGRWKHTEITILPNKNKSEIRSAILNCSANFSFVVFTGHGFYDKGSGLTHACVSDGYMSENDLTTSVSRRTLILDCCRQVEDLSEGMGGTRTFALSGDILNKARDEGRLSASRQIISPREKFDTAIGESNVGHCIGYACSVGQAASDNPKHGGVFSSALIRTGKQFGAVDQSETWLPIKQAIEYVKTDLGRNRLNNQTAEFKTDVVMSRTHPFAVSNIIKGW